MGYTTWFDVSIKDFSSQEPLEEKDKQQFDKIVESIMSLPSVAQLEVLEDCSKLTGEGKWYDHEEDMEKISSQFPGILFVLKGEGDESDDLWKNYFLNGQMGGGSATITYPACPW
jgi:hypothetical protein